MFAVARRLVSAWREARARRCVTVGAMRVPPSVCRRAAFAPRYALLSSCFVLALACGDDGGAASGGGSTAAASEGSTAATEGQSVTGLATQGGTAADSTADETASDETAAPPPMGAWETRASLGEGPRQETGVAALDGEVYVVGGFGTGGALLARVEAYDPASDTWRTVADLPQALHHANVAAINGELFVAGYLDGLSFEARGDVFAYDPVADSWSTRTAMPVGTERGSSGVAVYADRMYLFGGFGDAALDDVWVYDPALDLWDVAADLPQPLEHLGAATIGERMYVVGGRDTSIAAHTNALYLYDPEADSWSDGPAMPTSRGGIFVAAHDGLLYVGGGEGNGDVASGVFEALEVYDPASETWTVLPPMPTPRHGAGAAAVGELVFFPGGADVEAFGAVATHEAWRPG